jgi:hypothetical protein
MRGRCGTLAVGMNPEILIKAVNKAIRAGAVAVQTDVAIDPGAFETYIAELRADDEMAAFDGMFANIPHGGGISVGLPSIAKLLLARAIATIDVEGTVRRFVSSVADNAVDATAVMALTGIKVDGPTSIGPDISLVPMSSLPPSPQRGMALGQAQPIGSSSAIPCALTTNFRFGPVFYKPKTPQPRHEISAGIPVDKAQTLLEEAFDLLSVIGVYPSYQMLWVQTLDWPMASGMTSGWQSSPRERFRQEIEVSREKVEALGEAYFSVDPQKRTKFLRIPLDRLGRAGREYDFADRAIDLGIALESLLLHDIGDRGELSFRLSLRGAWLVGDSSKERLEIQKALKTLYDLRSRAVHSGVVDRIAENQNIITDATEICKRLIRKIIELKCEVGWQTIVVGGNSGP